MGVGEDESVDADKGSRPRAEWLVYRVEPDDLHGGLRQLVDGGIRGGPCRPTEGRGLTVGVGAKPGDEPDPGEDQHHERAGLHHESPIGTGLGRFESAEVGAGVDRGVVGDDLVDLEIEATGRVAITRRRPGNASDGNRAGRGWPRWVV